jgi:hypothetical protein
MSDEVFPVYVEVSGPDGTSQKVRVGTAERKEDGFVLSLGELRLGPPVLKAQPAPRAARAESGEVEVFPRYGRSKGAPIRGANAKDLEFYAVGARRTLADPSKERFHDKERALLAAIEAEMARQGIEPE